MVVMITGHHILKELGSRSFLHEFLNYPDGGFTFRVHDLVHDLALYVARDEFQVVKSNNEAISESLLHLAFIKKGLLGQAPIPTSLRSIWFPAEANNNSFMNDVVSQCKYLRVLQLHCSSYDSLPGCIGKLKHLRYLSLLYNRNLKRLPNSICKLQSLHILDLLGCDKLEMLPRGLGNLTSLRHLVITTKQSQFPKEIAKLNSLQILTIFNCSNFESLFEGVQFPSVKKLKIQNCWNLKYLSLRAFPNLEHLVIDNCHELALSVGYGNSEITKLKLKSLSLSNLSQLVSFPQWMRGCVNTLQVLGIHHSDSANS